MRPRGRIGRRGLWALEVAVLWSIVGAAFIGMAIYMKRAMAGAYRQVGDSFGYGQQWAPENSSCSGAACSP